MNILGVRTTALNFLRDQIITGELKAGEKLNEVDLSNKLDVSRPPLREAFRVLEQDGLVVNIPRRGTYVAELTVNDYMQVSQVREMIECYAVDLFKAFKVRELPEVKEALDKAFNIPEPFNSDDPEQLLTNIKTVLEFHTCMVESCNNARLAHIYHSIMYNLARYQFLYFHIPGSVEDSLADHKRTLALIQDGSYEEAKSHLREHIQNAVEIIKKKISTEMAHDN